MANNVEVQNEQLVQLLIQKKDGAAFLASGLFYFFVVFVCIGVGFDLLISIGSAFGAAGAFYFLLSFSTFQKRYIQEMDKH